jgi:E3 ubiquitin-protein ligase HUWE1
VSLRAARVFLDFDNKRAFFQAQLRSHFGAMSREQAPIALALVRGPSLLADSMAAFRPLRDDALRGKLEVSFRGEEGIDAGGLTREWYTLVARDIFRPDYGMWTLSEDGVTYQPNPLSKLLIGEDHLDWFKFVGRVLGKAVADGHLLDIHFTRSLYKHLLGMPVSIGDLEAIDPEYARSLQAVLTVGVDALGLEETFAVTVETSPGTHTETELVPGGCDIPVTDANAEAYVALAAHHKMTGAIREQIDALLHGFTELVPPSLISLFSPEELELLLAGLPHIDVADLRAHTEYGGYRPTDEVVAWFWEAVASFSQQDRARLLMFVTGTSKVPLGGFKGLRGQRGPQKFTIQKKMVGEGALPGSHTCFNTLDLPPYPDAETLRDKLLVAIRECGEGFGTV